MEWKRRQRRSAKDAVGFWNADGGRRLGDKRRMMPRILLVLVSLLAAVGSSVARGGDASVPIGEAVMERPTLRCLGAYWIIRGDDNRNASIAVDYRKAGEEQWRKAMPLFRVEKGAHLTEQYGSALNVPADGWLFAGSIVMLEADTAYEIRLSL